MPSKVYVEAPPDGDFRAMPARGGGYAASSGSRPSRTTRERGLPTVSGIVLLSDASDGRLLAELDAGALTALRTGAAAVLAAETLAAGDGPAAVIGCGVNGRAVARTFLARGRERRPLGRRTPRGLPSSRPSSAPPLPVRARRRSAADIVATVTPGREILFPPGSLRPGQHVRSWAPTAPARRRSRSRSSLRARVVVDEWEQASHNGDIGRAVDAGSLDARGRDRARAHPPRRRARAGPRTRSRCSTPRASPCRTSQSPRSSTSATGRSPTRRPSTAWSKSPSPSRSRPEARARPSRSTSRDRASRRRARPGEPEEDDGGGDPRSRNRRRSRRRRAARREPRREGSVEGARDAAGDRVDRLDLPAIPLGNRASTIVRPVSAEPRLELLGLDRVVVTRPGGELPGSTSSSPALSGPIHAPMPPSRTATSSWPQWRRSHQSRAAPPFIPWS